VTARPQAFAGLQRFACRQERLQTSGEFVERGLIEHSRQQPGQLGERVARSLTHGQWISGSGARSRTRDINLAQASALDLPYKDEYFDLVFTSGVLIHISPADLGRALEEIHRCAKTWIWGMEYYAPEEVQVNYRGQDNLLWKMDYAKRYLDRFDDLELVREQRLPYLHSPNVDPNVDTMFLLKRK